MFKKLLIVIFLFQTLASSAWGAIGVPVYTLNEQVQMKVMHDAAQRVGIAMPTMVIKDHRMIMVPQNGNANMHTMTCNDCQLSDCHNLLCASIHSFPVFNLVDAFNFEHVSSREQSQVSLVSPLVRFESQPELPPPIIVFF